MTECPSCAQDPLVFIRDDLTDQKKWIYRENAGDANKILRAEGDKDVLIKKK